MHNELVTYIQTHHALDGVEVRAVGPKAVTLALPPELHDVGNLLGELEVRFNARIDIMAGDKPGLGPTATVWVRQDATAPQDDDASAPGSGGMFSDDEGDGGATEQKAEPDNSSSSSSTKAGFQFPSIRGWSCQMSTAFITAVTMLAAAVSIARNGTALWQSFDLGL